MGSSSTNNQAEHQSSKVLRYGSLKSMKRSFTISVDQPRCFTLQLSGLEHCLSPASSQGAALTNSPFDKRVSFLAVRPEGNNLVCIFASVAPVGWLAGSF